MKMGLGGGIVLWSIANEPEPDTEGAERYFERCACPRLAPPSWPVARPAAPPANPKDW
jgi:hypothetical protein